MYGIIMTVINHHTFILSTAGQHRVRNITGYRSTEWGSDCHAVIEREYKKSYNYIMYLHKPKYSSLFSQFGVISPLILKLDIRWS